MKTRLLIILGLVLFFIPFSDAYASCESFIPVFHNIQAYDEASVVFFGTVIDAHEPYPNNSKVLEMSPEYTTFTVHCFERRTR